MSRRITVLTFLALAAVPFSLCFAQDDVKIIPDIVYGHKDGLAMTMDVLKPAKQNGAAILFVVSGGWVSRWAPPENFKGLFAPHLEKGYTIAAIRHGSSPRYTIPEATSDLRKAVRFIRKNAETYGIDEKRMAVFGMSAGGHLSLMIGTTGEDASDKRGLDGVSSRVAAVIAYVPPTDLRVCVWDAPESLPAYRQFPALNLDLEKAATYSPLVHVSEDDAPSLVIMGGNDKLVPPKHGEWIAEAFTKHKVEHKLMILPDAGHGLQGAGNRAKVLAATSAWLEKHLAK